MSDIDQFARDTLRLLGPAPDNWVPQRDGIDHNVVVVGGGQGGSAIAHALRRAGIGGVSVIDAAADSSGAGVWLTRARMQKLRTLKSLVGPELGITALGFQQWFETRHGRDAFAALDRISRADWAEYLAWFREFLAIDVRYGTRVVDIAPWDAAGIPGLRLTVEVDGKRRFETTRKLILANGVAGNGAPFVPGYLQAAVQAGLAAHTADAIDFVALRGKTVAVIGAAASAFDAAAVALEAGAQAVSLFSRRDHIAARAVAKPRMYSGFFENYASLSDAQRWQHAVRYRRAGSTPPADAVKRATAHANFRLHLSSPWQAATLRDGAVDAHVAGRTFAFDFVIAGTGYTTDPADRAELASIAPLIARWRDRYEPLPGERDDALGVSPYLGAGLEYTEKHRGAAPWLGAIHVFNPAGYASTGVPLGDIPSMRRDIPRIVSRVSQDLFVADLELHQARALADVAPDFGSELYDHAVWRG
ncbi:FAD-dependent oxidoreductase [Cupriavidus pauculus]|uniref:Monooxygenase n=1 Tax=Cupriavidus pauculus TaxID=82633 RepID=A0A2N5CAU3_9BURK|nr:FAD-dependent oxidoreductase [Cupriavidus pauculus]PLP99350.1 monooxygenase [Cupriavidus pauculus]